MSLIFPSHETMRLAAEAERIQSVASSSRDGKQPGPIEASPAEAQAAPFPHPHANSSQRAATGVDGPEPSALLFDPDFLAAWRETQYGPNDMEPRR